MKGAELYRHFINSLKKIYSAGESEAITDMVFEDAGFSRKHLLSNPGVEFEKSVLSNLALKLNQLLQQHPVQYVLGYAWFYQLKFKVTPAVLIPRPETEELVKHVLAHFTEKSNPVVLDVGTGSGCIPVSLAKKLPAASITAVDISKDALEIAHENAAGNNVQINFKKMDFLNTESRAQLAAYDCIVSNPPYIPKSEAALLDKNVVQNEPGEALFVPDDDPLVFYKAIADFASKHLKPGGIVFTETHENYAQQAAEIFNWQFSAKVIKDLFGKERFVTATHCR